MAYRIGNRLQAVLLPESIEDYVTPDAPVRAYDAIINAMNLPAIGIEWNSRKVGNSQYNPVAMTKLLVYGYSYGVRSSRKLERAVYNDLSFIWLVGGLKPDFKTIAEFRRKNKKALQKVLRSCARMCQKLDLIEGNTLFVDGSKFRANAGISNTWTDKKCVHSLEKIDRRIKEILSECEAVDEEEADQDSLVKMRAELVGKKVLKERIKVIQQELKDEEKASINTTDKDCVRVNGRQGSHAGYNSQSVVDKKNGIIVANDVVNQNNDYGQLENAVMQANETLDKPCQTVCADAGYANYDDIEKVESQGMDVIVPSKSQARKTPLPPFDKMNFKYDAERDAYCCPAGQWLYYSQKGETHGQATREYRAPKGTCEQCQHFGICTKAKKGGRRVTRYTNEEYREQVAKKYESPEGQAIYEKRKEKVELPFGHIKHNLGAGYFLLRGLNGVKAEMSLLSTCFNVARMITLLGVKDLIEKVKEIRV